MHPKPSFRFMLFLITIVVASLACVFAEQLMFGPDSDELPKSIEATPLTCAGEECFNVCLDNLEVALATRPFEPLTNEVYVEYKANITLIIYKVDGNELVDATKLWVPSDYLVYQEDTDAHQRIWDFYTSIIPVGQRSMVKEFVVFTDGPEGDLSAWVNRDLDNPDDWKVGFDILDSDYPLYLAETLIHEAGHLITLNTSQIPYDEAMIFSGKQNHPNCPYYITNEGCSLPDSYINHFYQKFWKNLYDEWWELDQEAQKTETYEEYQSVLESFYQAHQDEFITDYAATNIEEDLAESWTYFVLHPRSEGDDIATRKVLFFYDYPELVNLRDEIITGLCSYVNPK